LANPLLTRLPLILIEKSDSGFTTSTWAPPSGIWRKIADGAPFSSAVEAYGLAMLQSEQAGLAMVIAPDVLAALRLQAGASRG
jgi:hypothetical protein